MSSMKSFNHEIISMIINKRVRCDR